MYSPSSVITSTTHFNCRRNKLSWYGIISRTSSGFSLPNNLIWVPSWSYGIEDNGICDTLSIIFICIWPYTGEPTFYTCKFVTFMYRTVYSLNRKLLVSSHEKVSGIFWATLQVMKDGDIVQVGRNEYISGGVDLLNLVGALQQTLNTFDAT